jgi:hypothetical protein
MVARHVRLARHDLGLSNLLGPRVRDPAAVTNHVDHAGVQAAQPSEQERGRGVLAGIDDDPRAADRERRAVHRQEVVRVPREVPAVASRRSRGEHERDEAIAVDDPLKGEDLLDVEPVPAAERTISDLAPERTGGEAISAAAQLVLAHASPP